MYFDTLTPLQWTLLGLIPPAILALYFLKLKRAPVEVPSTYLWRQTIEDLHVNSFWQKIRQSILLFLQLLLIALAIIALLRPGWQGTKLTAGRHIFLVDNSASMSSTDADGGGTRLEAVKKKIEGLIGEELKSGMSAMIIAFADEPQVVQEFTGNVRLLKDRLATIEPTSQPTDLLGALKLAGGIANPAQLTTDGGVDVEVVTPVDTNMYIFSDGRFADVEGFDLGALAPTYIPVGSSQTNNLAITAFSTRRSENRQEEREAFVQVTNLTDEEREFEVAIELDGQLINAGQGKAAPGESASMTFPLATAPPGKLTATLSSEALSAAEDKLKVDDTAYAGLNDPRQGKTLLVTRGNMVVEAALTTGRASRLCDLDIESPDYLDGEEYKQKALAGEFTWIIYDDCAPKQMPRAHTLFLGSRPPSTDWGAPAKSESEVAEAAAPQEVSFPQVIDWSRSHPLLAYVELNDLWVFQSQVVSPPKGATVLIESDAGPLMAISPRESYEDVVLGFPILVNRNGGTMANTRWFKRRSFPTFWLNSLDYFIGQLGTDAAQQASPGRPIEIRPRTNVAEIIVRTPKGKELDLKRSGDVPFQFQDTVTPGVYEVLERGQVTQRFAVNLFNREESDIRLRSAGDTDSVESINSIRIGYTDVKAQSAETPERKEIWQWLLGLAIVVLLVEWWIYNRRVYL